MVSIITCFNIYALRELQMYHPMLHEYNASYFVSIIIQPLVSKFTHFMCTHQIRQLKLQQ